MIEEYLFENKSIFHKILSFLLLPFTLIYCLIVYYKRFFTKKIDFNIPIISIGNIVIGGSGKTPFIISLANYFKDKKVVVILRGYKRKSKGLIQVKKDKILVDVDISGDEAMEIALNSSADVIVSEDRKKAIKKAKELGYDIVLLDDGFSKVDIKKFEIILKNEPKNSFCIPSGPYRESRYSYRFADMVLEENKDFKREVIIPKIDENTILITGISNPKRVLKFINIKKYHFFEDHYNFKEDEIKDILKKYNAKTILTTNKDYVKLSKFDFDIKLIELKIKINKEILDKIENYVLKFQ